MKTLSGAALIAFACGLFLVNISDTLADLQDFHDAGTPQFIAAVLRQFGTVVMAALGGTLLPVPGTEE